MLYYKNSHGQNEVNQLNVATYGEQIKNEITNGIEITDTLKQILISEDGEIRQFETIAGNLMSDSIESVQLAPNGVVTDIYPAKIFVRLSEFFNNLPDTPNTAYNRAKPNNLITRDCEPHLHYPPRNYSFLQ